MTTDAAAARQPEWIVKGLMAARHMPTTSLDLAGVSIRPLSGGPKWTSGFNFQLGAEVDEGMKGTPIVALPAFVGFQAYHELELVIEATAASEAATAAFERFSRVAAAFAFGGDLSEPGPVVSVESVLRRQAGREEEFQIGIRHANLVIDDAGKTLLATIQAVEQTLAKEAGFARLLDGWARAERFYLLASEGEERRRALLAYAEIMEMVGNLVAAEVRPSSTAETEAAAVISDLESKLRDGPATEAGKAAIRNARAALERIDVTTAGQRMRRAGEIVGLDESERKAGSELWTLRCKKAGHDSVEAVSNEEVVFAREVADEYFRRYAELILARQSPPSATDAG